jgi:hypothetical protein
LSRGLPPTMGFNENGAVFSVRVGSSPVSFNNAVAKEQVMFGNLSEAVRLLAGNFLLIGAIVLTVWLPGNLLLSYLAFFGPGPDNARMVMRGAMYMEGIFGPIYIGAMVYALWQIKQGQTVGYGEAIGVGIRNWGRLFGARLMAGLQIMIGLLLFVVPGVVLALRYALLDSVVIIEGTEMSNSRRRSTELTEGIKLQMLAMAVFFYFGFILVGMMIYFPLYFVEELAQLSLPLSFALETAADCVLDIVYAVLQVAIFLYYWEKRQMELASDESPQVPTDSEEDVANAMGQLPEIDDSDNPYRSPQM